MYFWNKLVNYKNNTEVKRRIICLIFLFNFEINNNIYFFYFQICFSCSALELGETELLFIEPFSYYCEFLWKYNINFGSMLN